MDSSERQLIDIRAEDPRVEYVVYGESAFSVENLVAEIPTLLAALHRVMAETPDLLALDEGSLKDKVHPTLILNRIRMSFWTEYENAVQLKRRMKLSQIIGGICTEYFYQQKILTSNDKMAYILCPPTNYTVQVKEALQAGMETIREIVSAKVLDDDGFLIPRAADVVLKAVALLDMRVKGAIVQRVDQRNLNVNLNKDVSPKDALPQSVDELDQMIEQTKAKLRQINAAPVRELREPMSAGELHAARESVIVDVTATSNQMQAKRFNK
jgi:hypothetical protein